MLLYGMTPMLVKQVENLAPADIFLSADSDWMNYLQDHGLVRKDTRVDLLTTDLVLAAGSDNAASPTDVQVGSDFPLQKIIGAGRLAMCNPADHPAGKLGRAGFERLGLWQSVANKIAIAESPPAAVALVVRGEAPVALVFSTDVTGISGIKIADVFPTDSHPPIVFPAAILRDSHNADAARFFSFLTSPKAVALFERFGYHRSGDAH
jgi:molybdate transport system substrate-binding protein